MNDSKIGTWLMRDGGTAVVIHVNDETKAVYQLIGCLLQNNGTWLPASWTYLGGKLVGSETDHDLIRKVSDSTELKPWKPEKRWRPWTVEEAAAAIRRGLFVTQNGDDFFQVLGWVVSDGAVIISNYGWVKVEGLVKWRQHDGTPCGVEVEE